MPADISNLAAVHGVLVGEADTCGERLRVPIGRDVVYVYNSTHVVRAVGRSYYACTVAHSCSVRIRAKREYYGATTLILCSSRHALRGGYCIGTGIQGVPLKG